MGKGGRRGKAVPHGNYDGNWLKQQTGCLKDPVQVRGEDDMRKRRRPTGSAGSAPGGFPPPPCTKTMSS